MVMPKKINFCLMLCLRITVFQVWWLLLHRGKIGHSCENFGLNLPSSFALRKTVFISILYYGGGMPEFVACFVQ